MSSAARRVLGRPRLDQLDTEHLRTARAEITLVAAAELRPLQIQLESVELRQVTPLSAAVQAGFETAAADEQRVQAAPDQIRLTTGRAAQRSAGPEEIYSTKRELEYERIRQLAHLADSHNAKMVVLGPGVTAPTVLLPGSAAAEKAPQAAQH